MNREVHLLILHMYIVAFMVKEDAEWWIFGGVITGLLISTLMATFGR